MIELIRYENGVTIEVAGPADRSIPVKESAVEKVNASFDRVLSMLDPVMASFSRMFETSATQLAEAEIKIGVGFSAEGSIFVTKATAEANIEIALKFKK